MQVAKVEKLTGTITVGASSSETITVNYPSGFNQTNCNVVAFGLLKIQNRGYNWNGTYTDSGSLLFNAYKKYVNTTDNGITIFIDNPNTVEQTFSYKMILMKY